PPALDHPYQRGGPSERRHLQPLHPGPQGRWCRGGPQDSRGPRGERRRRLRLARRGGEAEPVLRREEVGLSTKHHRPGDALFTHKTPRVVAARRLTRRSERSAAGRFLAEGAQAAREALRYGRVHELFVTEAAAQRHAELVADAPSVSMINDRAAELLSETVSPQGIVAVCDTVTVDLSSALTGRPRLVAVLVNIADPGNAGTVLRVADAAGADAVIFAGSCVDVHNGKCVRASTG